MVEKASQSSQFSDTAIDNFAALFAALKQVHIRLVKEGYTITDNDIIPPKDKDRDVDKGQS